MIGYKFKITNTAGDYFYINDFVTDPDRFIALQDYPTFDVDIKNTEVQKEGQHGIWDFFSFYGKRVINFSGIICGLDEADAELLRKQILNVMYLPAAPSTGDDGTVQITWTDAQGGNWQISGKLQGYPRFHRDMKQLSRLYFNLTIKCKNPEIQSQELITGSGTRGWISGDLGIPALLPAMFDLAYNNKLTVANAGSIPAHTIIKLYGEAGGVTNPSIYDVQTGKLFKVNMVLTDATKWIEIDSQLGTVVDQSGADQSSHVDGLSEYIILALGDNDLIYTSDENPLVTWAYPAAAFSVDHRSAVL